ncbi:MAG: subclass B1 metallo-beta-lactamase [Porticoccaceae bacterium]|nr:subclass B1 metallo-beta-lactamase [Porticoccaceae bacterium]
MNTSGRIFISIVFFMQTFGLVFAEPDSEIQLQELTDGVWMHVSSYVYPDGKKLSSNGLIVKDGAALTLVDTAWGELKTVALIKAIKLEINLPITRAVVTHAHSDRAAGVDVLESHGVKVFSHPLTQRITIEHGLPVPNHTLDALAERGSSIKLGKLTVFYPGPAHAMDNLMVWLPEEKILFGGCAVRAGASTSAGNTSHGDTASWIKVMNRVGKQYHSAKLVVPGHGEPGGVDLIEHTSALVKATK